MVWINSYWFTSAQQTDQPSLILESNVTNVSPTQSVLHRLWSTHILKTCWKVILWSFCYSGFFWKKQHIWLHLRKKTNVPSLPPGWRKQTKKAPRGKSLTKSPFAGIHPISHRNCTWCLIGELRDVDRPKLVRVVISNRAREISCCLTPNDLGQVTRCIVSQRVEDQQSHSCIRWCTCTNQKRWKGHTRSFSAVACFMPFNPAGQKWGGHNACGYYSGLDLLNS